MLNTMEMHSAVVRLFTKHLISHPLQSGSLDTTWMALTSCLQLSGPDLPLLHTVWTMAAVRRLPASAHRRYWNREYWTLSMKEFSACFFSFAGWFSLNLNNRVWLVFSTSRTHATFLPKPSSTSTESDSLQAAGGSRILQTVFIRKEAKHLGTKLKLSLSGWKYLKAHTCLQYALSRVHRPRSVMTNWNNGRCHRRFRAPGVTGNCTALKAPVASPWPHGDVFNEPSRVKDGSLCVTG